MRRTIRQRTTREQHGSVVTVANTHGLFGSPMVVLYSEGLDGSPSRARHFGPRAAVALRDALDEAIADLAVGLVARTNVRTAADELGMPRATLQDLVMSRRGPLIPRAPRRRSR